MEYNKLILIIIYGQSVVTCMYVKFHQDGRIYNVESKKKYDKSKKYANRDMHVYTKVH